MLDSALTGMGFAPILAASAGEAIMRCASTTPQWALVDANVVGWADLLATLRANNPSTKCCLVSASGIDLGHEELAAVGVTCFFSKPFTLQQLRDALEEWSV